MIFLSPKRERRRTSKQDASAGLRLGGGFKKASGLCFQGACLVKQSDSLCPFTGALALASLVTSRHRFVVEFEPVQHFWKIAFGSLNSTIETYRSPADLDFADLPTLLIVPACESRCVAAEDARHFQSV